MHSVVSTAALVLSGSNDSYHRERQLQAEDSIRRFLPHKPQSGCVKLCATASVVLQEGRETGGVCDGAWDAI